MKDFIKESTEGKSEREDLHHYFAMLFQNGKCALLERYRQKDTPILQSENKRKRARSFTITNMTIAGLERHLGVMSDLLRPSKSSFIEYCILRTLIPTPETILSRAPAPSLPTSSEMEGRKSALMLSLSERALLVLSEIKSKSQIGISSSALVELCILSVLEKEQLEALEIFYQHKNRTDS